MEPHSPLSPIDFHVLLVLGERPLYGYAIKKAIAVESDAALDPEIGSLYRVLARLVGAGFVEQVDESAVPEVEPHPGRARKYYALTPAGERTLKAELGRLRGALDVARRRGLLPEAPA